MFELRQRKWDEKDAKCGVSLFVLLVRYRGIKEQWKIGEECGVDGNECNVEQILIGKWEGKEDNIEII